MIRLTKGPKPRVLADHDVQWTQELLETLAAGGNPTELQRRRYANGEIKAALLSETHGKCAYCESKLRHVTPGDIEHIIPKSLKPELSFAWNNLTVACPVCNGRKGTYYDDEEPILDPYGVDPSDHLLFEGAFVLPVPGSRRGNVTERVLELNRAELIERRTQKLKTLLYQLELLARETNPAVRAILRHDIEGNEQAATNEYCGLARHLVSRILLRIDQAVAAGQTV